VNKVSISVSEHASDDVAEPAYQTTDGSGRAYQTSDDNVRAYQTQDNAPTHALQTVPPGPALDVPSFAPLAD
jgi:hypothetical protein